MLTIQILTLNNSKTIEKCLDSLVNIKGKINIVDIGSTDNTLELCKARKVHIANFEHIQNRSKLRNQLLKDVVGWKMYLEPYEYLVDGIEEINSITSLNDDQVCLIKVAQDTIITQEIRLWNKDLKFINPVYETLDYDEGIEIPGLIVSKQQSIPIENNLTLIELWKKQEPTSFKPYYYQAINLLLAGKYAEFTGLAEYYLFKDQQSQSAVMLRYYVAMTQAYYLNDWNNAAKNILTCIGFKPSMAEFWCLLGDVHYQIKDYNKAKHFYQNAMILGSQRRQSDKWPIDISKYQEHPQKMIKNIDDLLNKTQLYFAK